MLKLFSECDTSEGDTNSKAGKPVALISRSNWNLECWFLWREENRRTWRKTLGAGTKNQHQTQPTCDTRSVSLTQATAVGGERSHHCAIHCIPAIHFSKDSCLIIGFELYTIRFINIYGGGGGGVTLAPCHNLSVNLDPSLLNFNNSIYIISNILIACMDISDLIIINNC